MRSGYLARAVYGQWIVQQTPGGYLYMSPWKLRGPSAGLLKQAERKTQDATAADNPT